MALRFGLVAGLAEAVAGGKALKQAGYQFDAAHTSALQRAQVSTPKRKCAVKCRVHIPLQRAGAKYADYCRDSFTLQVFKAHLKGQL